MPLTLDAGTSRPLAQPTERRDYMSESIFFNQGDALARDFDYSAARRSAQIYKARNEIQGGLVVAKDDSGKFSVFYEKDAAPSDSAAGKEKYTVLERL